MPNILRALLVLFVAMLLVPLAAVATDALVLEVPQDITTEATGSTGATVTYSASAHAADGRVLPVTCDRASGSTFPLGETTVQCSATDPVGNETVVKQFRVTVVDQTAPAISLPSRKIVRTRTPSGTTAHFVATAVDLVDGRVAAKCSPRPGTPLPLGTTRVTCTASDQRGNHASRGFDFTVVFNLYSPSPGGWISSPPRLAWHAVPGASYYNVQVFRLGEKVLSAWPTRPRLHMRQRWTYRGRAFRFEWGRYTWLVWPGYGDPKQVRYGRRLGTSSFLVVSS
jgi:hypothetical protein